MRISLARHDALMRAAIQANDGYVFKTVGDAFHAAFDTALQALRAAAEAQLALAAEPWTAPIQIRVRMALHTGAVEDRDNDYFGQPLNRVARLLSVGHGGQVLLSDVTQVLTRDSLPASWLLHPLGEHRLRDLARPEQIYQLNHPDLPQDFPPPRSLDNADLPNNLPQQLTSFIGREHELAEILERLKKNRLVTLTGSGGTGKTRLALQAAADALEEYCDGVWFIEFAALTDSTLVAQTVILPLGLREEPGQPLIRTLTDALKTKEMLLVLDNCEHVLTAVAQLADAILRNCPRVKMLASSREAISISGEAVYRVPPLSLPDPNRAYTIETISQYEAVRLFIERAQSITANFMVTNANAPALASICQCLDGIPFAIELAAARVRVLSIEQISMRLDDRFRLLTGGNRTALPRQQTLRAMIDWSYNLLTPQEQRLLARLSVFQGGCTLEAAESIACGEPIEDWEIMDLLMSLADKSLVMPQTYGGTSRYILQETVRQYAREIPITVAESADLLTRHRDYFVALAVQADPYLDGPQQNEWFDRLEQDHGNLRAALAFCLEMEDGAADALRLTAAIYWFWYVRGYISEGRSSLEAALTHAPDADVLLRSRVIMGAGILAREQGDHDRAQSLFQQNVALARSLGDARLLTGALNNLGMIALDRSDYETARAIYVECLENARRLGDKRRVASALNNLGNITFYQQDYRTAHTLYTESLALAREFKDKQRIATFLNNLGDVARNLKDEAGAVRLYLESLTLFVELNDRRGASYVLEMLAAMAYAWERWERAARLSGAARGLRDAIGAALPRVEHEESERRMTHLQQILGSDAYSALRASGGALSLEAAASYAAESATGD
jgi:predicted ATPase